MAKYTLILGTKDWSSWSLRAYLAMRAVKAPFDEVLYQLDHTHPPLQTEDLRRYSPSGRVPVLKIEENGAVLTVWDSLAICETLAERHPAAGLWPDDAHRRALARAYAAEMHAGFPDLRDQLMMDFAREKPLPELRPATRAQIARIIEAWETALSENGGPFLFGGFSIADCMYAPVASRFRTYGVALPAASHAYRDRIMGLPAMGDWMAAAKAEIAGGIA
jgi:glutathione S-transferase